MQIESQVISLELAKRLKELGVKQNAYQAWVEHKPDHSFHLWNEEMRAMRGQDLGIDRRKKEPEEYSAYSVAELGEMLPARIEAELDSFRSLFGLEIHKNTDWTVKYVSYKQTGIGYILGGYGDHNKGRAGGIFRHKN